ncbi:MAG TPA: hypothetical protein VF449_06635 [Parvibaculum sp.]
MTTDFVADLYQTLQRRLRPEDVADMIMTGASTPFSAEESRVLDGAARHSLKRSVDGFTSMSADFFQAIPPAAQVRTALSLFSAARQLTPVECTDIDELWTFVQEISAEIHKTARASSFKTDRLNRSARSAQGLDFSRRKYNKLFRFLVRFERKIESYRRQLSAVDTQKIAKSSLATRISEADFSASEEAACFIAYFVARQNLRSVFTNTGQVRAFDEVAQMLFDRFKRRPHEAGWRAIAYVMPDEEVIAELTDGEKLDLFVSWLDVMGELARSMEEIWEKSKFDRTTMIVARGDDSSTWNALAGAWNMARQGWLGAIHGLGMEDVLDLVCLGKAMRLMAADVASWHRADGGGLDPDTLVWGELPAPWQVFSGSATCTRRDVEVACAIHGVDPVGRRWVAPRSGRQAVPFRPTPELVHGVAVSHPDIAAMLRKAGWFSGKMTRALPEGIDIAVTRDPAGGALSARPASTEETSGNNVLNWFRRWKNSDPA